MVITPHSFKNKDDFAESQWNVSLSRTYCDYRAFRRW